MDLSKMTDQEKLIYQEALKKVQEESGNEMAKKLAELQKQVEEQTTALSKWDEWGTWYKESVEPHWNQFVQFRQEGGIGQQKQDQEDKNKEGKSSETKYLTDEEITSRFGAIENQIKLKEAQVLSMMGLNNQLFGLIRKNPDIADEDITAIVSHMQKNNIPNVQTAYNDLFGKKKMEKENISWRESEAKKIREEIEAEVKKNHINSLNMSFSPPSRVVSKDKPVSKADHRKLIIDKLITKHGAGVLQEA